MALSDALVPNNPTAGRSLVIEPASAAQRLTLTNLLQLYYHDFSECDDEDAEVNEDGRFPAYPDLDRYWSEPSRYLPFLFRVDGRLAGFALIRRLDHPGSEPTWRMVEFFILRRYRRRGLGRQAATILFDRCPGRWEVGQIWGNQAAITFWRRVIGAYTGGRFSEEPVDPATAVGPIQVFRTPAGRWPADPTTPG